MAMVRTRREPTQPAEGWSLLLSELLLFVLLSVALIAVVGRVPHDRSDLNFLCAVLLVLHGIAFARFAQRFAAFLTRPCPHCDESFHGYPDRYPVPFRKRCAHCGSEAGPSA